jgi:phage baseplate assembly protein W
MPFLVNPPANLSIVPIGLSLPIQRGKKGYFNLNYDTISQAKSNIINLLKTVKGERRFQPLFGSGLQDVLFEPNLDNTPDILEQIIATDITQWIPNVKVKSVTITTQHPSTVNLNIVFTVNNLQDSIDLVLQQNNF